MSRRDLYTKFALYYCAYTLGVFVLQSAFRHAAFESIDAFAIFGLTFYLVKTFTDRRRRALSDHEQKELLGVFGVTIFLLRAALLIPKSHDTGTAVMTSLLTSAIQMVVVLMAVISVRFYSSLKRL